MKKYAAALLGAIFIFTAALWAGEGERLFDEKCLMCHIKERPTPEIRPQLVAPPAMGVMFHVKSAFGDDRAAALAFIKEYVVNPDAAKAKCMPQSLSRFGVMPSQKGSVTEAELELICDYLYDNFPPAGFGHGPGPNARSGS